MKVDRIPDVLDNGAVAFYKLDDLSWEQITEVVKKRGHWANFLVYANEVEEDNIEKVRKGLKL